MLRCVRKEKTISLSVSGKITKCLPYDSDRMGTVIFGAYLVTHFSTVESGSTQRHVPKSFMAHTGPCSTTHKTIYIKIGMKLHEMIEQPTLLPDATNNSIKSIISK
jgi:hypothetical protein